jgi:hypothetical protein
MIVDERFPWVPYWPAKLLNALAGMNADQKLVYQIVLLRIYEVCGPCRDGVESLSRRCGINKRRVLEALDALFKAGQLHRDGDAIMNPFAAKVLADREGVRGQRVRAGAEGGKRAAENRKLNQSRDPSPAAAKPSDLDLEKDKNLRPTGLRPSGSDLFESTSVDGHPLDPEADLYRRGKQVLGPTAGGMVKKLLAARGGNVALARAAIETAATKGDPRQFVGAMISDNNRGGPRPHGGAAATRRYMNEMMEEQYGTAADDQNDE